MYKLFLDDERDAALFYPGIEFLIARTYDEAVQIVLENGLPEFVAFDHDLGDVDSVHEKSGYLFAKYLIDYMLDNKITTPFRFNVHSANPTGAVNIECYLKNGFKAAMDNG